ncbi:DEAD/DEAH box helicase [Nakamurella leprariae]|uniref:RNA helicase n=1 Tax=Nakamurella leprariae TaxID=2803911 RepID=A0A938Y4B3_9ACTN|nr:DEAD/DEAH box helicase [Nakamurella leprariae]MBM9465811.1 DEAD/DEAH box helicase [Nakamurella leprariae]
MTHAHPEADVQPAEQPAVTSTDVELIEESAIAPEDATASHPLQADAPVEPESPTFAELGVLEPIVRSLHSAGIERTFAIQALTLPIALGGGDLIGQARTGMGKTLGFGVPLLQRLVATTPAGEDGRPAGGRAPRGLVMVPTRELCVQVTRDLHDAANHLDLKVTAVYGGRAYEPQIAALNAGVDVVVGTPGRLLDLANSGSLQLGAVQVLVLDEADEMLDLGFLPDIERVLGMVPDQKQTMLFSATMPGPIITLARSFMRQPTHIRAEMPAEGATHRTTTQFIYRAHALDKVEMLARVLQARDRGLTMVFTRTKRTAAKVADELTERGFAAAAVHGDLGQGAREQALRAFRSGKVDVLVATDVAARGIDVEGVTHVVNFQCPEDDKTYVHRIGRTGRAGRTGVAVSFIDWDDIPRWKLINDALGLDAADPAETYSTSKHLFTDLDIPEGVTGRLPRAQRTREGLSAEAVEDLGETGKRQKAPSGRRDGRSADAAGPADKPAGEGRSRRTRTRTRSGRPADTTTAGGKATEHAAKETGPGPETPTDETGPAPKRRRARRRTRGGSGNAATEGGTAGPNDSTGAAEVAAAAEPATNA